MFFVFSFNFNLSVSFNKFVSTLNLFGVFKLLFVSTLRNFLFIRISLIYLYTETHFELQHLLAIAILSKNPSLKASETELLQIKNKYFIEFNLIKRGKKKKKNETYQRILNN